MVLAFFPELAHPAGLANTSNGHRSPIAAQPAGDGIGQHVVVAGDVLR